MNSTIKIKMRVMRSLMVTLILVQCFGGHWTALWPVFSRWLPMFRWMNKSRFPLCFIVVIYSIYYSCHLVEWPWSYRMDGNINFFHPCQFKYLVYWLSFNFIFLVCVLCSCLFMHIFCICSRGSRFAKLILSFFSSSYHKVHENLSLKTIQFGSPWQLRILLVVLLEQCTWRLQFILKCNMTQLTIHYP